MSLNSLSTTPPSSITGSNKKAAKYIAAVIIAGLLGWLSFRGADLPQIISYAKEANIAFIGLLFISVLLSHLLRAGRWLILLRPITAKKMSLWHSFCAVIYGYTVNIIVPRGGEIARLISICQLEQLPWAAVLPTLLIDRLLDLVTLALLLGFTIIGLPKNQLAQFPWLYSCGISLVITTVVVFVTMPFLASGMRRIINLSWIKQFIPNRLMTKFMDLLQQFELGTRSLVNPLNFPLIGLSSLGIWFFYWLNFHLMVLAFGLDKTLTLNKELVAFTIASVGALVPTPGCIGGFHLLVSQSLVIIGGINQNLALAFATVLHAFAFIIYVALIALVCFLGQNFIRTKNKSTS